MPTKLRPGIYLKDNPPTRRQFRTGRRSPILPVQVVHTAETGISVSGVDPKAEACANFIRFRTDAGSYHLLGDRDSIIQLVRFEDEAYGDATGSNEWAIHWSLAMDAAAWPTLPAVAAGEYLATAVQMALIAAAWTREATGEMPEAKQLTMVQSTAVGASGFVPHGGPTGRDPGRREDPGDGFPWKVFLANYRLGRDALAAGSDLKDVLASVDTAPVTIGDAATADPFEGDVKAAQLALQARGRYLGHKVDGVFGPASRRAVEALCESDRILAGAMLEAHDATKRALQGSATGAAAIEAGG